MDSILDLIRAHPHASVLIIGLGFRLVFLSLVAIGVRVAAFMRRNAQLRDEVWRKRESVAHLQALTAHRQKAREGEGRTH